MIFFLVWRSLKKGVAREIMVVHKTSFIVLHNPFIFQLIKRLREDSASRTENSPDISVFLCMYVRSIF